MVYVVSLFAVELLRGKVRISALAIVNIIAANTNSIGGLILNIFFQVFMLLEKKMYPFFEKNFQHE